MGYYFENHLSMFAATGFQITHTLETVVNRFVGNNPPHPMTYRAYSKRGIRRTPDYRYLADFNQFFPDAKPEQFVYAWAKYWSDAPATFMADVSCFGPLTVYLNNNIIFQSDIFTERYADKRHRINLPLQAGWNHFVLKAKKTRAGFGGIFGTWLGKHPYYFLMPTSERDGQEGWIFSEPTSTELATLPGPGSTEESTGLTWRPELAWPPARRKLGQLDRIYGKHPRSVAVCYTTAWFNQPGTAPYTLTGTHVGDLSITIRDQEVFTARGDGKINARISIPFGHHPVHVKSTCPAKGSWGFTLQLAASNQPIPFQSCCAIQGTTDPWIYIGPFAPDALPGIDQLRDLSQVHPTLQGDDYWRIDAPDTYVRPYNENTLFARWNYPLGVTLYGLLHAARSIQSPESEAYVARHMAASFATFKYALWDKAQYGGATAMHTLLSSIDSLDDCGSFGSAMLEVAKYHPEIQGWREIADYVADYISNKQARLEDGTFYRKVLMHIFHENTMWADDLYMSVPFLCRYAALTGDNKYLDDAASQFLGFKKRLYLPDLKVMAHIFDFRRNMNTGVPWGRGNGWPFFSLSELLAVLPENHELRPQLLDFFRDLAEGYLALQDDQGMWHQVLTHPDAYPETSCTAMFAYGFARGIRYGWLAANRTPAFANAVLKAWEGINKTSIDKAGNIHGVCRGSEFSFTPEYYKKELLPNLNDTHGIGIVLLAGVETLRLIDHLQDTQRQQALTTVSRQQEASPRRRPKPFPTRAKAQR